jgi:two-component system OmpR family sensor kinase
MAAPARLLRPWRWPVLRTIRGRLIAGLVALLAVASAAVGVTSYFSVRNALFREVGSKLQTATSLAYNCQDNPTSDGDADDMGPPTASSRFSDWRPGTAQTRASLHQTGSMNCPGLGTGTLTAAYTGRQWTALLIPSTNCHLTASDKRTLLSLPMIPPPPWDQPAPAYIRSLSSAYGDFELTAVRDPDDGKVYFTGLPLASMRDTLRDVAFTELVIFGAVLLAAGAGGTIWVRLSLRPLRRVAATATQVAELPLEAGQVELPDGVTDTDPVTETGQVGSAFNLMLGHVQTALVRRAASEARLRRFAADASHELRTPLASIRGYAELALRHPGESPEPVTHALSRVLSESTRMSMLVDDLLLLARLDAGRPLSREPVDMSRLAIDATSDSRVARPGHRWVLDLPDYPVLVSGDEHRLQQVLTNLLSNAGRHTPIGTMVTVKVSSAVDLPGDQETQQGQEIHHGVIPPVPRVVLTVTDDGPGIPPDLLPDLFERFTRADTSRSHPPDGSSTGLGLAIVDAVVAAHDGAVLVTSRPGLTRFSIALPRLAEPDANAQPSQPRPARKTLHRS